MEKKKRGDFRGKTTKDAKRQKQNNSFGYTTLPKGVNMISIEPGSRVKFDIIPYEVTNKRHPDRSEKDGIACEGDLWYKLPFKIHRNVGANKETVVCPTSFGKKCPICEYRAEQLAKGVDFKELKDLKASKRNLYNLIPIDDKKNEEKVCLLDISQYCFQDLLNTEIEEDDENENFPSLEDGKTLKVRFEATTIGTSKPFSTASRIDFLERKEEYDEAILDKAVDLDKILNVLSYQEIHDKFFEVDDEDTDDDKKEEKEKDDFYEEKEVEHTHRKKKEVKEEIDKKEEHKLERRKKKAEKVETKEKNKCPFGHTFGKDCDNTDDCDKCEEWNDCDDAQTEMEAE